MKNIKLIKQNGNHSIGVWQNKDGSFLAMTYTQSKPFKTINGALRWLKARGFE